MFSVALVNAKIVNLIDSSLAHLDAMFLLVQEGAHSVDFMSNISTLNSKELAGA